MEEPEGEVEESDGSGDTHLGMSQLPPEFWDWKVDDTNGSKLLINDQSQQSTNDGDEHHSHEPKSEFDD